MLSFILTLILGFLFYILYKLSTRKFDYWQNKVKFVPPVPVLGNYTEYILLKKSFGEVVSDICKVLPNEPCIGAFYGTIPTLIVQDPELIKRVLTKDFYYFNGKESTEYTNYEIVTQSIVFTCGDRWKVLRQNLTPLFSSSKMRNMFQIIENCSGLLEKLIEKESLAPEVEVRSLMMRYTLDSIGGCVFGVDTNVMVDPENNIFEAMGDRIFENSTSRGLKIVGRTIWPGVFYRLGFKVFPTDISNFFTKFLTGIFEARGYKPSARNDFIDLMLSLKENKYIFGNCINDMKTRESSRNKVQLEVNDELLVAQCVSFFAAGFETSASTSSFVLYELAKDSNAQQTAQEEVDEYIEKHDGKLDYDCVKELPYLEACIHETLRLYSVFGVLVREVMEKYTFPDGLTLNKGDRVHIPVHHLHYDAKNFPEPDVFKSERFIGEAKNNIKPYTYLPFGEGPRNCIGMRFAKMQMLAGLVTILKNYTVALADSDGMPEKVDLEPKAIVTRPTIGIRLKFLPRSISKN